MSSTLNRLGDSSKKDYQEEVMGHFVCLLSEFPKMAFVLPMYSGGVHGKVHDGFYC